MAFNGGTVVTDKTKLNVFSMEGSAADMQEQLRLAIANGDVIVAASVDNRRLTVLWYDTT
tara:strand:+ start:1680 stop:1859 length:180 start_codon:yes stop_codon:yes gene_type:complete